MSNYSLLKQLTEVISLWHLAVPDEFSELCGFLKVLSVSFLVSQPAIHISFHSCGEHDTDLLSEYISDYN